MAQKGRLTKVEQERRFKLLCGFIFIFRYATRKQLDMFVESILNIKYPQWLIQYAQKQGLIKNYSDSVFRVKIYYLAKKGKDLLYHNEPLIEYYRFEKDYAGLNTFEHHNLLVESYFLLQKQLEIKEWVSEWAVRVGKKKGDKLPDGLIKLSDGLKLALEAETSYKTFSIWRWIVKRYRYDIKWNIYHAVILIAAHKHSLEGIILKLSNINQELCNKAFIFTYPAMLKTGECFYQNKERSIQETLGLLRQELKKERQFNEKES